MGVGAGGQTTTSKGRVYSAHPPMVALCRRIVDRPWFHNGVLAVIVLNALPMGLATDQVETTLRRDRTP